MLDMKANCVDYLEDLAQYVRVSFRSAANEIEGILKNWAAELGGMIREYDRDKYVFLFSQEQLEKCVENKFEILETEEDTDDVISYVFMNKCDKIEDYPENSSLQRALKNYLTRNIPIGTALGIRL